MQELLRTKIKAGLTRPVRLLHITDVHLTAAAPGQDSEELCELLARRKESFRRAGGYLPQSTEELFEEALDLAEELCALPVITGDAFDLHSRGNLDLFRRLIQNRDVMYTPGGHEYQTAIRRTMEEEGDYALRMTKKLARELPTFDLDLESRVIGGLNVVTVNSGLDYFNRTAAERFEKELSRGLPTVVFTHDPPNDQRMGITEPYHPAVKLTKEDYAVSNKMLSELISNDLVIATFSGHWHRTSEEQISGKTHFVTDGLFRGVCRLIEVE